MRRSDSILRNSVFIFLAKVIDLLAAIAGFVLVARILGVTGLGRYSFVIAYVSVFGLVVNLGIDHIIIREIARERKRLPAIIGAAVRLKLILLSFAAPLLAGGLLIYSKDQEIGWSILLLFIAMCGLRELFTVVSQAVFLGCERLEYRTITTFVFQLMRTAGIAGVLLARHSLIPLFGSILVPLFGSIIIADIVQAFWTVSIVKRRFGKPDLKVDKSEVWEFFKQVLPIGLAYGFAMAFLQLDILLLTPIRGEDEAGLFSSAYKIVSTLILVVVPMIWVLLPHLTKTFHNSRLALKREGEFYLKFIAGVMFPASALIAVYSTWLVTTAFGSDFASAGLVLTIVAPTLALRGVSYLFDLSLTAARKQVIMAVGAGTAFTAKLILELILIPNHGYIGAAWSTLGAELIAFVVVYTLVRRYVVKYSLWGALFKPTAAIGVTLLLLWWLKDMPLLGIPAGAVLFIALMLAFGTFNGDEREKIVSLIARKTGIVLPLKH